MEQATMANPLNIAVVGVGNWGKNVLRAFARADRATVRWICDADARTLTANTRCVPNAEYTTSFADVLGDDIDAVVIATAAPTHFALAERALRAGKHVFVEKPICLATDQADDLVRLADARQRSLMVGHLLLYHPCVTRIKTMIDEQSLGDVRYLYTQRVNLGVVRQDENAWWSLAPHDISIALYLFGANPQTVTAVGKSYLQCGVEDVVFATLSFPDGRLANIHVSWLDPHKIRKLTVVGTQKMVTFDDMEPAEKLRIYDKGADVQEGYANYATSIAIRSGDILIPRVLATEPLVAEAQHFVDAILDDQPIRSDGRNGAQVVRVLEAGAESIHRGGEPVPVTSAAQTTTATSEPITTTAT
jgi:predicted dehydrogenase